MLKPSQFKYFPADLIYKFFGGRALLYDDMMRQEKWETASGQSELECFNNALTKRPFRNIFYFRMKNGSFQKRILLKLCKVLMPAESAIEIGGEIGSGLLISHNHCVIHPERAGNNLRVGPGVVIGRVGMKKPKIGDNVYIAANATVIGDIEIGNNVIIGAGSVVVHDIPCNVVVVGNPAHVIREIQETDYAEIL